MRFLADMGVTQRIVDWHVDIQINRAAKALHECHGASLSLSDAGID